MKLVLLGGTGRVGSNVLKGALERGHEVLAIARHPENIKTKHDNLQIKNVSIFDENALAEELQGKDALISCIGGAGSLFNRHEVTIYSETVKVFANALRRSGVSRIIVMSAWWIVGDSPPWVKALLTLGWRNVCQNMRAMELFLQEQCTDLDHTAVKICFGKGQHETGKPILTHEGHYVPRAGKFITYGDLTKFILDNCLQEGEWKKKMVSIGT